MTAHCIHKSSNPSCLRSMKLVIMQPTGSGTIKKLAGLICAFHYVPCVYTIFPFMFFIVACLLLNATFLCSWPLPFFSLAHIFHFMPHMLLADISPQSSGVQEWLPKEILWICIFTLSVYISLRKHQCLLNHQNWVIVS